MEPEHTPLEKEKHLETTNFGVPCQFSGVYSHYTHHPSNNMDTDQTRGAQFARRCSSYWALGSNEAYPAKAHLRKPSVHCFSCRTGRVRNFSRNKSIKKSAKRHGLGNFTSEVHTASPNFFPPLVQYSAWKGAGVVGGLQGYRQVWNDLDLWEKIANNWGFLANQSGGACIKQHIALLNTYCLGGYFV